jgi:hypothetical protein
LENCIAYTRDFWRCLNLISFSFAYSMIDMISICSLCIIMALVILYLFMMQWNYDNGGDNECDEDQVRNEDWWIYAKDKLHYWLVIKIQINEL